MIQIKLPLFDSSNIFNSLTKIFALVSVFLFIYILIRFFTINKELPAPNQNSMITDSVDSKNKILPSYPPFAQYAQAIEERNFFQLPKETEPGVIKADQNNPPSPQDLTKNIKILGIMLSKKPQAIVLNTQTSETLILSLGDKINGLQLSDIQKNEITFEHDGQSLKVSLIK